MATSFVTNLIFPANSSHPTIAFRSDLIEETFISPDDKLRFRNAEPIAKEINGTGGVETKSINP